MYESALHTPDEIAPAILPYVACMFASGGSPIVDATTGKQIIPEGISPGSDCRANRDRAEREALELLRKKGRKSAELPEAVVAAALSEVDTHVASTIAAREARRLSGLPDVPVPPITMEDEVFPAFQRYHGCLMGQVRDDALTSANVTEEYDRALAYCAGAREQALADAAAALVSKNWAEPLRRDTARKTFDKFDEAWNATARHLQRALDEREIRRAGLGDTNAP